MYQLEVIMGKEVAIKGMSLLIGRGDNGQKVEF